MNSEIIVEKLPLSPASLFTCIQRMHHRLPDAYWFIEDVGKPRAGTRLNSVHTFSKHRGHLEMALIALGISPRSMFVPPMTWMTEISPAMDWPHGNESRQVKERKKWFHRASGAKVPQYAGDAVCIMLYGERYVRKNH